MKMTSDSGNRETGCESDAMEDIEAAVVEGIKRAVTDLPPDVEGALREALRREDSSLARLNLETILKNVEIARDQGIPMCQDTGTLIFYVRVGTGFKHAPLLKKAITGGVKRATEEIPLRPNTVHPFKNRNMGWNLGPGMPIVHFDIVEGDTAEIVIVPKGGGSENPSRLKMLNPTDGMEGVRRLVLETVAGGAPRACPPIIVGVGIGGGADMAVHMAKKAASRPVGQRHPCPETAELEEHLLREINSLGIGPMGLGGHTTALDVHIEYACRHPASFPAAVVFQCWAARRAKITLDNTGKWEVSQ